MNIAARQKQTHRQRMTCAGQGGAGRRTGHQGSADAVIYRRDKQDPTIQHRELIQTPVINRNGKEYGEKRVYMYN